MGKYAATTSVSIEKSEVELKQTLRRYDVEDIATMSRKGLASVMFSKGGRAVRFSLEVAPIETFLEAQLQKDYPGLREHVEWQRKECLPYAKKKWEQEERRIWRVLIMVIKAHFELAEETGFDQAFAANIVLPGGQTVAEYMLPQIDYIQATGVLPDPFADLMPHRALPAPAEDE